MRIISGRYRGKKLASPPKDSGIRPTTDRTKEALFNILAPRVNAECVFLDLFSGSGAIGLEALSRGAKKVYFVDNDRGAVALLKKNLTGIRGCYEILETGFENAVSLLQSKNISVDIVYADPPYGRSCGGRVLAALQKSRILKFGGVAAIERDKTAAPAEQGAYMLYDTRSYALSAIDFYTRKKKVAITGTFDPFTTGHRSLIDKARALGFDLIYIVLLVNSEKKARFTKEKRIEIINIALNNDKEGVFIDDFDGLTVDYCNMNDIQYILRGVRDAKDTEYERQMAEYNYKNGGVTTILMPATSLVSSTMVRESLDGDKDVSRLVDDAVIKTLKE